MCVQDVNAHVVRCRTTPLMDSTDQADSSLHSTRSMIHQRHDHKASLQNFLRDLHLLRSSQVKNSNELHKERPQPKRHLASSLMSIKSVQRRSRQVRHQVGYVKCNSFLRCQRSTPSPARSLVQHLISGVVAQTFDRFSKLIRDLHMLTLRIRC